jgi:hypothetical protein
VSDYRLDEWGSIPGSGKKIFPQTSSEAHQASYPIGTVGLFPGTKRGRGVTLTTHPHLMPRSKMRGAILLSSLAPAWRSRTVLLLMCKICLLLKADTVVKNPTQ